MDSASSPSKNFSPVSVPESPLSMTQGNLTGYPRKVRDSVALLHNGTLEWKRAHLQGLEVLRQISCLPDQLWSKDRFEFCQNLHSNCCSLEPVINKLNGVIDTISELLKNFKALQKLEEMKSNSKTPIFLTWTFDTYISALETFLRAYTKELKLKTYIKEKIGFSSSKNIMHSYIVIWNHQAYINEDLDYILAAMLKETGHT